MASPILAVNSKTSILNAPKIAFKILNAILRPPPITIEIKSRIANKPCKVLVNLSAFFSTLDLITAVNLCNPAIILNNVSPDIGGKAFLQALPIEVNILTKLKPIFLNEFINKYLPFIWSILLIKSFKGIPV